MNILKEMIGRKKYRYGIDSDFNIKESVDTMPPEHVDWVIRHGNFDKTGFTGKGERIAILDTGVDANHADLRGQVDAVCFIDNCEDSPVYFDRIGHGTFCAGEVVAKKDGIGVVGVAPEASAFCGKVIYGDYSDRNIYGFEKHLSNAIRASVNDGCGVISMSLGMNYRSPVIEEAVNEATEKGVLIFAAAGNEGMLGSPYKSYPAAYENVISVAAANSKDMPHWFTTYGQGDNIYEQPEVAIASLEYYWGCLPQNKYGTMVGTCLTGDALIMTENGPVEIANIKIGDMVFGYDFNKKSIVSSTCKNWFNRGVKKVYKLKTNNFSIEATENHPFLVAQPQILSSRRKTSASSVLVWKKLSELKTGDKIVNYYKLPEKNNLIVNGIKITEDLCQLVGLFLGDGYILHDYRRSESPYGISFCMFDLCNVYSAFIQKTLKKVPHEYNGQLTIYSVDIGNIFYKLGLDKNSYTKRIPSWTWTLPLSYKQRILAGLIDSDGTVNKKGQILFELCNENLLNDIKYFCQSMGMHVSNVHKRKRKNPWLNILSRKHYKQKTDVESYSISVTSYVNIPFLDNKYRERFMKSIKNKFGKRVYGTVCITNDIELDRISSIQYVGDKNVYDIEIESIHNFIANGLIVHNSMACPMMAGVTLLWREAMRKKNLLPKGKEVLSVFREWLKRTAKDTNKNGWDPALGFGVLLLQDGVNVG